jgi:hypothetical protein
MNRRLQSLICGAAFPVAIVSIYIWLAKQSIDEAAAAACRRWWPGPPIDHP